MGRRRVEDSHPDKIKTVRAMRAKGAGVRKIAAQVGLGVGTVLRLVGDGFVTETPLVFAGPI